MKLPLFLKYALACNVIFAGLYVRRHKKRTACIQEIDHLKRDCVDLEQHAQNLTKKLNGIKERSTVEAYARNNLGMEKVNSNQKRVLGNV